MPVFRVASLCSLIGLTLFVIGCDQIANTGNSTPATEEEAKKDPTVQALNKVGMMYHLYHDTHAVGPASWEDLATTAGHMGGEEQDYLDAIQTVKDKGYNLKWGVKFRDLTEGMTNTVMGESSQGGPKLMFDGSVSI